MYHNKYAHEVRFSVLARTEWLGYSGERAISTIQSQGLSKPDMRADLPRANRRELVQACAQLTDVQARRTLRQRYMPFVLMPGEILYVAAGRVGLEAARKANVEVIAIADAKDLMFALQQVFGPQILHNACHHLKLDTPAYSAARRFTGPQLVFAGLFAIVVASMFYRFPVTTMWLSGVAFAITFVLVIAMRLASIAPAPPRNKNRLHILQDAELPVYTVLVPMFRETRVLRQLLAGLSALDYPPEKLDIKLILEETDHKMRKAMSEISLPAHFEIIVVGDAKPQTKPKALNYALHFARGDLAVIFDAEDVPESGQLRLAASRFAAAPAELVCLQASLTYYNANENWLTRQFTIEYAVLFDLVLPFLASLRLPLPLGGTSNHFRMGKLRALGGWDPFNVTEDADLGIRLARFGWYADVLDSATYEEANNAFGNWMHQRARWLKGWIQTWLVHMRNPLRLWRQLGAAGFMSFQIVVAGIVVSTLFHPLFTGLLVWQVASGQMFDTSQGWLQIILSGTGLGVLVAGYAVMAWAGFAGLSRRRLTSLSTSILGMPVYWLMISLAGWLALKQFITHPFHWNKTRHGLSKLRWDRQN